MAWQRTQTHFLALPPATVWEVLRDPARAPEWHGSIARLRPHAVPARAGTLLDLLPAGNIMGRIHGATAPPAVVTDVEEGTAIGWRQPQPGGHLEVRWSLREVEGGTELTQRVSVAGSASAVFARFGGRPIAENFAENCVRLYALAGGGVTRQLRVVITGGHGFLGSRAAADLVCRGHEVVVLTRGIRAGSPFTQVLWDGKNQGPWSTTLYRAGRETAVLKPGRGIGGPASHRGQHRPPAQLPRRFHARAGGCLPCRARPAGGISAGQHHRDFRRCRGTPDHRGFRAANRRRGTAPDDGRGQAMGGGSRGRQHRTAEHPAHLTGLRTGKPPG
ncbi:SRPBCC family protein [Paeniglutamicibacter sp. ABSL32-1]|nr:SRPBCC family protein [Paeniglutamicibacter quisquiliarum]